MQKDKKYIGFNLLTRKEVKSHKAEIKFWEKRLIEVEKRDGSPKYIETIKMWIDNLKREIESHVTSRKKDAFTAK